MRAIPALLAAMMVSGADDPSTKGARALHERAIVLDTHSDLTSRMLEDGFDPARARDRPHGPGAHERGRARRPVLRDLRRREFARGGAARRALEMIDAVRGLAARHPDELELATSVADPAHCRQRSHRRLDGHRRRPRHREQPGRPAHVPYPRRPLHDPHSHQYQRWCDSSGDKPAGMTQRPRTPGRPGDEPARSHRRRLSRLRRGFST